MNPFFGTEIVPGDITWIEASADASVQLTNACLVKVAKKRGARVVLEICENGDNGESSIALAVLSANGLENVRLDVLVPTRMGLRIVGPDAEGAVVHVVGNVFSLNEDSASMDSDDAMDMEFSPGVVNMEVLYGHNSSDDSDDSEDSKDSGDSDETSGSGGENEVTITLQAKKTKREKPKPPASEFKEGKLVLKKKQAGLPVITDRSGLKYQDILVGSGKRVVKGHNVALQYVLRLENGKVIDKADRKRPFKFRLGIGECVKGFDIGVSGMREGGERHLIVPPQLGYGDQSPPGIPRNATLYFDIIVVKAF